MSNADECADDCAEEGAMEMEIDETVPNTSIIENKRISDSFLNTSTDAGNDVEMKSIVAVESKQMVEDDKSSVAVASKQTISTNIKEDSKDDDDVVVILDDGVMENVSSSRKKLLNEKLAEIKECDVINLVDKGSANSKCINYACKSGLEFVYAPIFCLNFYRVNISKRKNQEVCMECLNYALEHYEVLAEALKNHRRLMDCPIPIRNDLVEIDDSDSEEESEPKNCLYFDEESVKLLDEVFDDVINRIMEEYKLDAHCEESIKFLRKKAEFVKGIYLEVDTMLHDVRYKLDRIHHDLYAEFKIIYENLPALDINDSTPSKILMPSATKINSASQLSQCKTIQEQNKKVETERRSLRKSKAVSYAELDDPHSNSNSPIVVDTSFGGPKESIEAIEIPPVPPDLPISGPVVKPALKIGEYYYAARLGTMGSWVKVRLINMVKPGDTVNKEEVNEVMYYVAIESKLLNKNTNRLVYGKDIAYSTPCSVMLEVGTRVIAIFRETSAAGDLKKAKRDTFYPGIIAEPLSYSNRYRYLIFFDDGYAQYVNHNTVYLIYESSKEVWKDMHSDSQPFIKKYLEAYPERPMVKLRKDQTVRTEYNGKWWLTTVTNIDCSLVQMFFDASNRVEWIYRGSTRLNPMYQEELAASARHNKNRIPRAFNETGPYVQYTRTNNEQLGQAASDVCRSVARKSTSTQIVPANRMVPPGMVPFLPIVNTNTVQPASKVVYFTPRAQANTKNLYKAHTCSFSCKNYITYDVKKLKGYNPLSKPLLCGWNRVTYKHKGKKEITYKAPCGRFLRNMSELHKYLRITKSEMTIDLFDFDFWVHCLAEFVLERNSTINKDMSNGLENVAIPVVNYVDDKKIPFSKYSIKREPMKGVPMNLDPNFLCGCDCEDDCQDKTKCQCWQLTLQGMAYMSKNTSPDNVGYIYRRLPEPVSTGIYECNSRCKCAKTCLNRVVQNPLQLKLQVFNTGNRGWGIRCLNDIPQGAFICIYAGSLLTEQEANEGGQHHGDEYFAELDYIEVVEKMKEDYEDDVVMDEDEDKKSKEESADEEEINDVRNGKKKTDDPVFVPSSHFPKGKPHTPVYKTRLRTNEGGTKRKKSDDSDDDTVTISDDEDGIREPSSFNPKNGDDLDESRPSLHKSVRQMYADDECVYIMDAKVSGNIGRFLNHSCSPNVFVQNVFVDTHDLRFPWVAFFALTYIRAGTELTWNYNYDIGSVPGKMLHCYCGSDDCRGRLL